MRKQARALIVILILAVGSVVALSVQSIKIGDFERGGDTILGLELGLDLQGGSHLVYQAVSEEPPSGDDMAALRRILERRVNNSGLGEPIIQVLGSDRVLVQLPGVKDPARAKSIIGETAQLEILHRTLTVPRDIEGVPLEDILSVRLTTVEEEQARLIAEALASSTAALLPTSTATTAGPDATPALGEETTTTATPMLSITFTPRAADNFEVFVVSLLDSLLPIKGSEEVYPSFLTVAARSSPLTEIQMPFTIFSLSELTGQLVPVPGETFISRVEESDTFNVILPDLLVPSATVALLEEALAEDPQIVLGEIAGRVDEEIGLTGEQLARAYAGQHQGSGAPIVNIEFNGEGTRTFGDVTTRIAGTSDQLAIFLDDQELIAPVVQTAITGGSAFIQGRDFTIDRVRDIALLLEAGRLPLPIELIQERDVDAILGADSLKKSVVAGGVGLALVLFFMTAYYRVPGLIAALALAIYAALVLAVFKLLPVTLTLSGVAAAILSVGMAVDANILIFERTKDELRQGRTLVSAINLGFNRAWPAIRDGNVSTLITCGILFWFADTLGATIVQGFAVTLAIGVGLSMFSAIIVSRTLLRITALTGLSKRPSWFVPVKGSDLPQLSRPEAAS